jgi:cyanophycinase-like exopeptidase
VSGPRVLAIMGSGETAPTMAKVHRSLFDRFAERPVPGAILDTPYGFQENADDLSARTLEFFATSVGNPVEVATFRDRDVDAMTGSTAIARIREARYVMAGPGSPSYALRQWAGTSIPDALAEKLSGGGILTMASAAALTLGVVTIPVYEIYKVGDDPAWLEGLDLLGAATGLRAAVVPHYDNAEGGNHDTRFCYMGERRLQALEAARPEGSFILGVDSHTALLLDLDAGLATVAGLGGVTVRVDGRSTRFEPGASLSIDALGEAAHGLAAGESTQAVLDAALADGDPATSTARRTAAAPLRDEMATLEGAFVAALDRADVHEAVASLLDLDSAIAGRVRGGEDSPDLDNASATFRSLIVRLGERAETGGGVPRETVDALVGALLAVRDAARANRDWATADLIRDRLADAGIEVRDGASGSTWVLAEEAGARNGHGGA